MTPQHEQWECDLIAPSAAPGLNDGESDMIIDSVMHSIGVSSVLQPTARFAMRALAKDCDRSGYVRGYAAGQAHPQGQGEPVAWRRLHVLDEDATMWRLRSMPPPGCGWEPLYAAPAASHAAPAAVAEPQCIHCGHICGAVGPAPDPAAAAKGACPNCGCEEVDHRGLWTCRCPAKAQEPDALLIALAKECGRFCPADRRKAIDRIEQLQAENWRITEDMKHTAHGAALAEAQHEADAVRIERWRGRWERAIARRDEAIAVGTISYERAEKAEGACNALTAARDEAVAENEALRAQIKELEK